MIDKRRRSLVGGQVERDEDALDLQEVALQRIQVPPRLKML